MYIDVHWNCIKIGFLSMVSVKLKHLKVGYLMVRRFVHVFFLFGPTHNNFEINHWFLKNYAA